MVENNFTIIDWNEDPERPVDQLHPRVSGDHFHREIPNDSPWSVETVYRCSTIVRNPQQCISIAGTGARTEAV